MSRRPTLAPPEYSSTIAVKMLKVPKVTMKGGNLSRVTSRPLTRPKNVPRAMPRIRARKPGTPLLAARFAMNIMAKMQIAPTDKSIPAVRMTSVCPMASAAMIAVCWMMIDNVAGWANRGLMMVKMMNAMISTISGLSAG